LYHVKECIIVEGVYDKIKLSNFLDATIFVTDGFRIYHRKATIENLKKMAQEVGVVILTDSDSAGFRIRNYLKQMIPSEYVRHAYIPEIAGKERRKTRPGKEGILGVEGVSEDIILEALKKAGCTIDGTGQERKRAEITKADFVAAGISGGADSSQKRAKLAEKIGLPGKMSSNMLLDVLNRLMSREEFFALCAELSGNGEEIK